MSDFTTRPADKSDLGGIIPGNILFPADFREFQGEAPSNNVMTVTMDDFERDDKGKPRRRFELDEGIDNREGPQGIYNQAFHRYGRRLTDAELKPIASRITAANQVYTEYGMGPMSLHTTKQSNNPESKWFIYGVFANATLPVTYEMDPEFIEWAEVERPEFLSEPFQTREGLAIAISQPSHVITRFQSESIDRGQAIAEEFLHPGLPGADKLANDKLLRAERKRIERLTEDLLISLNP
jgi:hypothetical protein